MHWNCYIHITYWNWPRLAKSKKIINYTLHMSRRYDSGYHWINVISFSLSRGLIMLIKILLKILFLLRANEPLKRLWASVSNCWGTVTNLMRKTFWIKLLRKVSSIPSSEFRQLGKFPPFSSSNKLIRRRKNWLWLSTLVSFLF